MKIAKRRCRICKYEWLPRVESPPKQCPNCGSRHWQTGKKPKRKR